MLRARRWRSPPDGEELLRTVWSASGTATRQAACLGSAELHSRHVSCAVTVRARLARRGAARAPLAQRRPHRAARCPHAFGSAQSVQPWPQTGRRTSAAGRGRLVMRACRASRARPAAAPAPEVRVRGEQRREGACGLAKRLGRSRLGALFECRIIFIQTLGTRFQQFLLTHCRAFLGAGGTRRRSGCYIQSCTAGRRAKEWASRTGKQQLPACRTPSDDIELDSVCCVPGGQCTQRSFDCCCRQP